MKLYVYFTDDRDVRCFNKKNEEWDEAVENGEADLLTISYVSSDSGVEYNGEDVIVELS